MEFKANIIELKRKVPTEFGHMVLYYVISYLIESVTNFVKENYAKPPNKIYVTNKTSVYSKDDTRSMDLLGLSDYGADVDGVYTYILEVIDTFLKILLDDFITKLKRSIIERFVCNSFRFLKTKAKLIESDTGIAFVNKSSTDFTETKL